MWVLFKVVLPVLLLLCSNAASAAEECDLPDKVKQEEVLKVFESRWVLVEGFSDYPAGEDLLRNASSSVMEADKTRNNSKTILFIERNIVNRKCLTFHVNMSAPDPKKSNHTLELLHPGTMNSDGQVSPYDDKGKADIYQTCPDCATMIYSGVFDGVDGRMLLIYRREGKHLDTKELEEARSGQAKLAECLKFNVPSPFKYDGKTEFCEEKKD
ncbi:saxitoxin and tetrodotoxin-binding protein 1-like [Lates japonicus]|uniref:Saxitoxin and tetrodotoxin-binding protein 1-like protein n=1 Tax=Lates japonicus TaxID=270547 RepID=A0AAD3RI30_LATJO|nr:saxitoxin and tetrodotoxin-binding protein 1-like protein [Lates japonicus]